MKALILIFGLIFATSAMANDSDVPTGSASATVKIQLVIGPRYETPTGIQECASSLGQQARGEISLSSGCNGAFDLALVSSTDDTRRRLEPI